MVKNYLSKNYYDVVLHFAVYGNGIDKSKDTTKSMENNLRIFTNFANCSKMYGTMSYTGTGAEYDKRYPIRMVSLIFQRNSD